MTFISTTPPDAARDAVAAMYRRQQASWGYIPNYAKVFCHRPEVMARWGQLLAEIKRPMDTRRFELATFVAAHEARNTACALAHGKALREFFSDEQIVSIAEGRLDGVLNLAEQALVGFARQVAKDASKVTARDVAALKEAGCSDAEVFDINQDECGEPTDVAGSHTATPKGAPSGARRLQIVHYNQLVKAGMTLANLSHRR